MQLSYGWRFVNKPHLFSCAGCGVWYSLDMLSKVYKFFTQGNTPEYRDTIHKAISCAEEMQEDTETVDNWNVVLSDKEKEGLFNLSK